MSKVDQTREWMQVKWIRGEERRVLVECDGSILVSSVSMLAFFPFAQVGRCTHSTTWKGHENCCGWVWCNQVHLDFDRFWRNVHVSLFQGERHAAL